MPAAHSQAIQYYPTYPGRFWAGQTVLLRVARISRHPFSPASGALQRARGPVRGSMPLTLDIMYGAYTTFTLVAHPGRTLLRFSERLWRLTFATMITPAGWAGLQTCVPQAPLNYSAWR